MEGRESKSYGEWLNWEYFSLEKKILRSDVTALHSYLKGGCIKVGVGLFSQKNSDERTWPQVARGNTFWDIRRNLFTESVGQH